MDESSIKDGVLTVPRSAASSAAQMLPDGLVAADVDGLVTSVNRRAEQILDMPADELLGRDIRVVLPLETRNGESWWALTDPWGGLRIRTGHREKLLQLPDGSELLVTARYLRAGRAGPLGAILLALRDAEARRRAEQDHAALISTIAHELRSPLTGVKGFSSTLLRRWDQFSEEQRLTMLEAIDADADRLTRLITDLLDVSRIDTGRLRIHEVPVSTRVVFNRHVERAVAAGHEDVEFSVDVAPGAEEVYADPDRLDQVVANLVENALRHGRGRVALSAEPTDGSTGQGVTISIRDDGEGIPAEQRRAVFSRFWHGPSGSGTGLGLYIVRGVVEAHGGQVDVDDAIEGGAVVRAFFPGEPV
ncbi:histidine kinase [Knoellia sinensis KCTC 19936]|uniref:histidine kinase n=1 Tax=Knoellia sinensis KCTC 19936 TaxID=1385520 RepID=A0A0A0JBM7_9MICO|nr:HAMP domain-containing sensor histidine kinase [Knoellia sinensis]KGN34543.1 histidine kinase [Knoellia sinensis KCTC 19936]